MPGPMIPMLAMNALQNQKAEEEARRRELAGLASPGQMPSRQPRAPSYAQAMARQAPVQGGAAFQRQDPYAARPAQAQAPAGAGSRQGPGSFTPPQPNAAPAMQHAAPNAAFQRQDPYGPPTRAGTGMPSPQQAAMQPGQMMQGMAAQGAANASAPIAAAGGMQGRQPESESHMGEDMGALGMAVAGQQYSDRQQDDAIRRQALAGIATGQARANGAPTYGVEAAQARAQMDQNEGDNYLAPLLEYYRSGRR